jgi:PAS domain S-box-containing protein
MSNYMWYIKVTPLPGMDPMFRQVNREALMSKNQQYLESLRKGNPDLDIRSQILGSIFDSAGDAMVVCDETKRIVLANETAALISGFDLEDQPRHSLKELFKFYPDEQSEQEWSVQEEPLEIALREKRSCMKKALVRGPSLPSTGIWVEANASSVLDQDGNIAGGVTVFRDVTDTVRAQQQRDCLISLITHDLKNHLASEVMFFKIVQEVVADQLDAGLMKVFDSIQESNERFLRLTESLLELSRSSFLSGNEHAKIVDLKSVLEFAIASNASTALQAGINLTLTVDAEVPAAVGLPASIGHVFTNVILNAIEVSEPNATVSIHASCGTSGRPSVSITDTGPGMTEWQVNALFDPRRVAAHQMHSTHSTGFGLFLTAMLVESQGGRISCRSMVGEGTTVTIELPASNEESATPGLAQRG